MPSVNCQRLAVAVTRHMIAWRQHSEKVADLIREIPCDGGSRTDLGADRQLPCHKRMQGFRDIYGRMSWDDVAPTITGGCINPSKGRFLHPDQDRAITLREAALLQSFPRSYIVPMVRGLNPAAVLVGNAFPPEFVLAGDPTSEGTH